jgi:hypothetical protein
MAVSKRTLSPANTRQRRAQWAASQFDLVTVYVHGAASPVPRQLVPAYRGLLRPEG